MNNEIKSIISRVDTFGEAWLILTRSSLEIWERFLLEIKYSNVKDLFEISKSAIGSPESGGSIQFVSYENVEVIRSKTPIYKNKYDRYKVFATQAEIESELMQDALTQVKLRMR